MIVYINTYYKVEVKIYIKSFVNLSNFFSNLTQFTRVFLNA